MILGIVGSPRKRQLTDQLVIRTLEGVEPTVLKRKKCTRWISRFLSTPTKPAVLKSSISCVKKPMR